MARRIPDHYLVRRPLTLWGKKRNIGDVISREEAASITRVESLVRSGYVDEKFEPVPVDEPVEDSVDEPVEEQPKPVKKAAAKKSPMKIVQNET